MKTFVRDAMNAFGFRKSIKRKVELMREMKCLYQNE